MTEVAENISLIQDLVRKAALESGRKPEQVRLIAVSKKQPLERVKQALDSGHRLFGENRVQEAEERWANLKPDYPDLELHLIGPLQTNKVKEAVSLFDCIETIDREKLVKELAAEIKRQQKNISCLVQVNTGEEEQKAGVIPAELPQLLKVCSEEGLKISGLMCIPPVDEAAALHFAFLKKLAEENGLSELSMGMSDDFEKAIPLGATYVRVGTSVFGKRGD